jgi:sugar lactone lactonase YvrE
MTRLSSLSSLLSPLLLLTAACSSDSEPVPALERVASFDPAQGQLPEGLAVVGDTAYVGFAPTGVVARVDLASGAAQPWGKLPTPVPNKGFMTGLAARGGDIFAALVSFVPDVQAGVYRIPAAGGDAVLLASSPAMAFPNAIELDPGTDALFVTDSGSGTVFRVTAGGAVTPWAQGALLAGQQDACGAGLGPGFDIGANGLIAEPDAVYVVNTDKATLIRIPRNADGSAGAPSVIAGPDCGALGGADGLVRDGDGFLVAVNRQDQITRITAAGEVAVYATGDALDFPASLARSGTRWIGTSFAFANAVAGTSPRPGLFALTSGAR